MEYEDQELGFEYGLRCQLNIKMEMVKSKLNVQQPVLACKSLWLAE